MSTKVRTGESGQSLIQVLVAVAVMGIMIAGFTTMIDHQQRETRRLAQKLASLDLQRMVTDALAEGSACTYALTNPALPAFNPMTVGPSSGPSFSLNQIPTKGVAGAPAAVSVSSTVPASPLSSSLFVNGIRVADLACVPSPCTATTNQFTANMIIDFDQTKLATPIASLKLPVTLKTVGASGSQTVSSCGSAAGGGSGSSPGQGTTCGYRAADCPLPWDTNVHPYSVNYLDAGVPCEGRTLITSCTCWQFEIQCQSVPAVANCPSGYSPSAVQTGRVVGGFQEGDQRPVYALSCIKD